MTDHTFAGTVDHLDPLVVPIILERKRYKLTQQELADMAGLSRRALGQIERGGDCTLSTIRRLYTALNIDVEAKAHSRPTLEDQIQRNELEFQSLTRAAPPHRFKG